MTTQPLDVVYNPLVLDHISEFFSHSSLEDAQALQIERQLREVARVRYEELKNQTRAELVQRLDAFMAGSDVVRTSSALLIYSYTVNKYTLFDGLAYSTCGYFASCVAFFQALQWRGKIRTMSNMSARNKIILYAKPSNKRFIIPL